MDGSVGVYGGFRFLDGCCVICLKRGNRDMIHLVHGKKLLLNSGGFKSKGQVYLTNSTFVGVSRCVL